MTKSDREDDDREDDDTEDTTQDETGTLIGSEYPPSLRVGICHSFST